ncbi:hypothetical protein SAMN06265348_113227 [Pedobacter westerhofensis]|uniref:Metallo-peptidase family M12B Reprolysin-like n=1 Tax=Pedobacter westerhofensis TaxID=425512 RepID=A0A521FLN6_9SPHI|nr:hypothetical protein [Pedobacter westerhofensis]SMO97059.1 hypothetical protein SAMN06265348_113227 [Pedobacter westerhofensis]
MSKNGGWTVDLKEYAHNIRVDLRLGLSICDSTKEKRTNLIKLGNVLTGQMKRSYQISYYKDAYNYDTVRSGLDFYRNKSIAIPVKKLVNVSLSIVYRIISNVNQRMNNEHLLNIVPDVGEMHQYYGMANKLGGSDVLLNESKVDNIIKGFDNNTLPHEFGHTLGLVHVDLNIASSYAKNQQFPIMRQRTKDSTNVMFGGKSRYMHNTTSTTIVPEQIDVIIINYRSGIINQ